MGGETILMARVSVMAVRLEVVEEVGAAAEVVVEIMTAVQEITVFLMKTQKMIPHELAPAQKMRVDPSKLSYLLRPGNP